MQVNIPSKVRKLLYIIGVVGQPTMFYLAENGVVSSFQLGLWVVVSSAVFALARINVTPDETIEE